MPVADPLKGRVIGGLRRREARDEGDSGSRWPRRSSHAIESTIGKIARPKTVHIVPDMPKTRSGKIMRRVLAGISNQMDTGDITTLANPDIVEQIRKQVQGDAPVVLKKGPADIEAFGKVD